MLWYRYRQVPGRQNRLPLADSRGAQVSKEPGYGKDGPHRSAADMALAVWNGYVHDARRHARQWRPIEQALQDSRDSKDVGLVARARRRSSFM